METYSGDQLNGAELKLADVLHEERRDPHRRDLKEEVEPRLARTSFCFFFVFFFKRTTRTKQKLTCRIVVSVSSWISSSSEMLLTMSHTLL